MKRKCLVLQHEKVNDNFWFVKIQVSCVFAQEIMNINLLFTELKF